MRTRVLSLLLALAVVLAGCADATGLPSRAGQYDLQAGSVCADGDRYGFSWLDSKGELHRAESAVQSVSRDERNYVEVQGGDKATLHLRADESVPACPEERGRVGWLPFPIPIGGPVIIDRSPAPSNTGSGTGTTESKPGLGIPKKETIKDAPFSVGGQSGGTGGGTSASGKSGSGFSLPFGIGGQSGGTGSGTGASGKSSGGFKMPKIGGGRSFGGKR